MTTVDEAVGQGLQYGEVVDIAITGARVSGPLGGSVLFGVGDDTISLGIGNEQVTVTRSTPADGEPQPGDIWRGKDGTVLSAYVGDVGYGIHLLPVEGYMASGPWQRFHKGNVTGPIRLVYRLTDDPHYLPETEVAASPTVGAPPAGPAETGTPPPAQHPDGGVS